MDRPDPTLAAEIAARGQTDAGVREVASMIAVFRQELTRGHIPDALADDLTREYALKLLGADHDDDKDGD